MTVVYLTKTESGSGKVDDPFVLAVKGDESENTVVIETKANFDESNSTFSTRGSQIVLNIKTHNLDFYKITNSLFFTNKFKKATATFTEEGIEEKSENVTLYMKNTVYYKWDPRMKCNVRPEEWGQC